MEFKGQNIESMDVENGADALSTEVLVEEDDSVIFEGNLDFSPKTTTECMPEEQRIYQTEVIQVGNITSGKAFILSFTDSKYKQINQFPFLLRDGTETSNDKDDYYHYNHHWDLREGHDIETISEEFPEIFLYENRSEYGFEEITEAQYTDLMRYKIYRLIKNGQFVFVENDEKKVYVIWDGNEVRPPVWYFPVEWKEQQQEVEEEVEDAEEEVDAAIPVESEAKDEVVDAIPVEIEAGAEVVAAIPVDTEEEEELEHVDIIEDAAAEVAVAGVDAVEDVDPIIEFKRAPDTKADTDLVADLEPIAIPMIKEEELPRKVDFFSVENEIRSDSKSYHYLLDEVRKMDIRIQNLETQLNQQAEKNKKHQTTINLLVILSVVIAAGVTISLFL